MLGPSTNIAEMSISLSACPAGRSGAVYNRRRGLADISLGAAGAPTLSMRIPLIPVFEKEQPNPKWIMRWEVTSSIFHSNLTGD
ncbi:UNVERIFIED_CONTAM: hypothetical protein PYX00_000782 [Menopon gallinae]|uniref:Uncharacterized protein n=1 Tax=Menopon gallinae TaxID=328185 RepID=A0AAW2IBP1_9NEOP